MNYFIIFFLIFKMFKSTKAKKKTTKISRKAKLKVNKNAYYIKTKKKRS